MKFFLALAVMLGGCSHAYVSQYDKESVTTCCPTQKVFCTDTKLEDMARDRCGGEVSLIGAGTRGNGNISLQRNLITGAIMGAGEDTEKCQQFKCGSRDPENQ